MAQKLRGNVLGNEMRPENFKLIVVILVIYCCFVIIFLKLYSMAPLSDFQDTPLQDSLVTPLPACLFFFSFFFARVP